MPYLRPVRCVALLVSILVTATVSQAAVLYVLQDRSTFQDGCFAPCLCPVLETDRLSGNFELGLITVGDVFDLYAVDRVQWRADGPTVDRRITGNGTYRLSTIIGQQDMTLDLTIDQNLPEHFTSGTVPTTVAFPEIDVTISKNGVFCWDTVMDVLGQPTPRLSVETSSLIWDSGLEVVGYDVVAGNLRVLRATRGDFSVATDACLADDLHDHTIPFSASPDPGEAFFVVVRAGKSTYDSGAPSQIRSRDPGIAASPDSCP